MEMSSKIFASIPVLGLGSAGVFAGYRTYRLSWPQKWFEPQLVWEKKLTLAEHQQKMKEFEQKIKNERYEKTVTLKEVPMPGNTMVWAHQDDVEFWKKRSNELKTLRQTNRYSHIPYEVNKLKSWCSLHLNTRVYVSKGDNSPLKFRISKDDHVYVSSLAQVTGLADVRNNCARVAIKEDHNTRVNWNDYSSYCGERASINDYTGSSGFFGECVRKASRSTFLR